LSTLPPGAVCTAAARELACALPLPLGPGDSIHIKYVISLPGYDQTGHYPDHAYGYSAMLDPDPDNNHEAAAIDIGDTRTDLTVTKTAASEITNPYDPVSPNRAFVAGGPFAYQITVQVSGNGADLADAETVTLHDDSIPAGLIVQRASASQGSCDISDSGAGPSYTPDVVCQLDTLASGAGLGPSQLVTVIISGVVANADELSSVYPGLASHEYVANVSNDAYASTATALVGGGCAPPSTAGCPNGQVNVDLIRMADLQLVKTPDAATVIAGSTAGYTLTVTNGGPTDVADATVTDTLPDEFAFDPTRSDPRCSVTSPGPPQVVACQVGGVAVGQHKSVLLAATTDYNLAAGTVADNTATVSSDTADPDSANNTATAPVTITRLTDLGTSSSLSTTTPAAGQDITFTGYVVNNGPSSAVSPVGDTVFPAGFVPVSYDVAYNACSWTPQPPADPYTAPWKNTSYSLHCVQAVPGVPWEPGGSAINLVVMHIPADTPAGTYSGTSRIKSSTPETHLDNNATTQTITVQRVSDTSINKTLVAPNPMVAGEPATWRLTVTNTGPSSTADVVIADSVPAGMSFVSARLAGGPACPAPTVDAGVTTVRCPVGALGVGQSASALITFRVAAGNTGRLCNTALVGSQSLDPDATDNLVTACDKATTGSLTPLPGTGADVRLAMLLGVLAAGAGMALLLAAQERRVRARPQR
ncbi:MAG: DUF11 domain-containing protein, partial [Actinomycetia bacterium]|nr:DUF11 domain-containing protein [Actinomycetes bacterium]